MFSTTFYVFTISLHLILFVCETFSNVTETEKLPACVEYVRPDSIKVRSILTLSFPDDEEQTSLKLPTVTGPKRFELRRNQTLKCAEETAEIRVISLQTKANTSEPVSRNFRHLSTGSTEAHSYSYFLSSGHFYDHSSSNYYKPDGDYCVASYSADDEITLKVCAVTRDCTTSSNRKAWCLPKCCAADEVLLYWKKKCVKRSEIHGITPWIPPVFKQEKTPNLKLDDVQSNLIFHMATLPKDCNFKHWKDLNQIEPYKLITAVTTKHPTINETHEKENIKLVAPRNGNTGIIRPMIFFTDVRRWKFPDVDWTGFCVDGFYVKVPESPFYTGEENNYMVYYCDDVERENEDATDLYSWVYFSVTVLSLIFLLITLVAYLLLCEKQNLHGLTTLSYVAATFLSYLFLGMAHFASLFKITSVAETQRDPLCYAVAVLAHYFFISSYSWLTVMNFDLWITFKSVRPIKAGDKEWRKIGLYSIVAWILPLLLVATFITVDEVYRDPTTQVPVPDYAMSSCFVSTKFRGEYLYIPMAVILGFNIVLIGLTMKIFIDAKRKIQTFSGGVSNANRYSAKLFCKLFVVMQGTSLIDFLTWYYNNTNTKPGWVVATESFSYLFTTMALFSIYCLNEKVLNQLQEKYPALRGTLQPVLRLITKQDESSAVTNKTGISTANSQHERDLEVAGRRSNTWETSY